MFIYEIMNVVNGKKYIGQTLNFNKRWKEHTYKLKNNVHENSYLQNAWNKYGEINFIFSIILKCKTEEELSLSEKIYIQKYNTIDRLYGYNLQDGGGKTHFIEHRLRRSKTRRPEGYSDVVDKDGVVYKINNLRDFARTYNLTQPGLRQVVVTKKYFHYHGWRLATPDTIGIAFNDDDKQQRGNRISMVKLKTQYPKIISPNGTIYIIEQLSSFCREHNLSKSNVSQLMRGKKESYKGWKSAQ